MSTRVENSTIPFHIARAYGQAGPSRVAAPNRADGVADIASIGRVAPSDRSDISAGSAKLGELVAAVVPGRAEFGAVATNSPVSAAKSAPTSPGGSTALGADRLPFYRRPSDQNEVAVAIRLGRSVDVSG